MHGVLRHVNGYCGLERDGWVCILCGTFSYWPHSRGDASRYRRNPNRKHLPEIARADLDVEVAVEHIVFEPESPVGTAPAYVALIDLTASERTLESVKSAVLAAMEAAGDAALFGRRVLRRDDDGDRRGEPGRDVDETNRRER